MRAHLLLAARRRTGRSLRLFAQIGGTSHATLSAYESGAKSPTIETARRIIEANGLETVTDLRPTVDDGDRGEELRQVLELADQFPVRIADRLPPIVFGRTS